jgi:hypothetical protein
VGEGCTAMMRYFTQSQIIRAAELSEQRGYRKALCPSMLRRHTHPDDEFLCWWSQDHWSASGVRLFVRCSVRIPGGGHQQIDTDCDLFDSLPQDFFVSTNKSA